VGLPFFLSGGVVASLSRFSEPLTVSYSICSSSESEPGSKEESSCFSSLSPCRGFLGGLVRLSVSLSLWLELEEVWSSVLSGMEGPAGWGGSMIW
jgi:hypothetical protein